MATRLNLNAEELPQRPVTLPVFKLPDIDVEAEAEEAADRIAERRVIRAGLDAWRAIGKAESFESWKLIGEALLVGKRRAQRIADEADGWRERNYIYEFGRWMRDHGFSDMPKSVRSMAVELAENLPAIEAWRATLPERQRKRLIHPLSNVRRWRATMEHGGKSPADYKMEAVAAWRKFLACMAQLPAAEQMQMWAMVGQARITDAAA